MRKRRKEAEHEEGTGYNLPQRKIRRTGRNNRAVFKPDDRDFRALLNNAYRSKLSNIIESGLKQYSGRDVVKIKEKEFTRKKVPPGTFESLDTSYGSYWTANTAKRLKLDTFNLYLTFVNTEYDDLLAELKQEHQDEQPSTNQHQAVQLEEETRSIVVQLNQVLREDLPADMKTVIIKKFSSAISQQTDYAYIFSFVVEMAMKNFALSVDNTPSPEINSIIPAEFRMETLPTLLPTCPSYPSTDDISYMDYKNLFSLTHLQMVSTINFGTAGIQNQSQKNHPFWTKMQNCVDMVKSLERGNPSQTDERNVDKELLVMMNKAKDISTTIKKSVVSNFSTNLDNMYQGGKKFKKAVDVTLNILLKLHLQPQKEREKRKRISERMEEVEKIKADNNKSGNNSSDNNIITRDKARSLLKRYRKSLKKYEKKNNTRSVNVIKKKIEYVKSLKWIRKVIYNT